MFCPVCDAPEPGARSKQAGVCAVFVEQKAEGLRPVDDVLRRPQPVEGIGNRAAIVSGLLVASELRAPTERIVGRRGIVSFGRGVEEAVELLVVPRERETQTDKPRKASLNGDGYGVVVSDRRLK